MKEGAVGDVALELIELAGEEGAALAHDGPVQLGDERGLADARVARDERELGPAVRDHALERGEQRLDLALAAVEPLRDLEPVGDVALSEREGLDGAALAQLAKHRSRSWRRPRALW